MINPEGLRFADEFVRHKMLDAVGDLSPSRAIRSREPTGPIAAAIASIVAVLEELFSDRANYAIVEKRAVRRSVGLRGNRRTAKAVPVFAPDLR